jgi:hypothetical protein
MIRTEQPVTTLRDELRRLQARYDYHFPLGVYAVIRRIEAPLAWRRHVEEMKRP